MELNRPEQSLNDDPQQAPADGDLVQRPYADLEPVNVEVQEQRHEIPTAPAPVTSHKSQTRIRAYRRPLLARLALPLISAAIIFGLIWFAGRTQEKPEETPPNVSPTAPATPRVPSLPAERPFDDGHVSGTFIVESAQWDAYTLSVNVRVKLDSGSMNYTFMALDSQAGSGNIVYPNRAASPNQLDRGRIDEGQEISGTVIFSRPTQSAQVALTNLSTGNNIAMVKIPI